MVIPRTQKPTCRGVMAEAKHQAREKHENRTGPQPWIVLKLTIGLALGLIGYTSYVYTGRLAIPMIREDEGALGGRALGIVLIVVFSLLLLMTLWTYEKVVLTPPGQAKDVRPAHTPVTSPKPEEHVRKNTQTSPPAHQSWDYVAGPSYDDMHPTVDLSRHATISEPPPSAISRTSSGRQRDLEVPSDTPSKPTITRHKSRPSHSSYRGPDMALYTPSTSATPILPNQGQPHPKPPDLPPPLHSRRPPTTPVLLPEYRYCYKDEIYKPVRAHHCRACGSCILKYDHHCPWIGQCVGARNHKFFVNFLQWVSIFSLWVFSTMLGLNVNSSSHPHFDLDVLQIVDIAIAGLFSIFTVTLLASHIGLIIMNQTTVEHLGVQAMKGREGATLARLHPWYNFSAKRRTKMQWDAEWGKIGSEGNLWWLGSKRANWFAVMGRNPWWWFLPIGRSSSDGMAYPMNPRFDEQGRWRRRVEWPVELQ